MLPQSSSHTPSSKDSGQALAREKHFYTWSFSEMQYFEIRTRTYLNIGTGYVISDWGLDCLGFAIINFF